MLHIIEHYVSIILEATCLEPILVLNQLLDHLGSQQLSSTVIPQTEHGLGS